MTQFSYSQEYAELSKYVGWVKPNIDFCSSLFTFYYKMAKLIFLIFIEIWE